MPAVLNSAGYPACCDYPLQPDPVLCLCVVCGREYETEGLLELMAGHRGVTVEKLKQRALARKIAAASAPAPNRR